MQCKLINYNDHNSIINFVIFCLYTPSANQIEGLFCKILQIGALCFERCALRVSLFLLIISII